MRGNRKYWAVFCIALVLFLVLAAPVSATTYVIDNTTTQVLFQQNVTGMADNDILDLAPGTYWLNNINITHSITIRANATNGGTWANTILDGSRGSSYAIEGGIFNASREDATKTLTIDNLTLRNGNTTSSNKGGGGCIAFGGSLIAVTSSAFINCTASDTSYGYGGAINARNLISGNDVGGNVTVTASSFTDCTGAHGGAIHAAEGSVNVTDSTFSNCKTIAGSTGGEGGAIRVLGTDAWTYLNVTNSSFTDCSATGYGGALYKNSNGEAAVNQSTFINCTSGYVGGAIFSTAPILINQSTITGSRASSDGGAIYISNLVDADIEQSTITNSSSEGNGGSIYCQGNLGLNQSTITGSRASGSGGAIYFDGSSSALNGIIQYNRLGNDTAPDNSVLYWENDGGGTLDATDNWWGTNDPSPVISVHSAAPLVTYNPYLVLGINATASSPSVGQSSQIQANLSYDSSGTSQNQLPEGIPVLFYTIPSGLGTVSPSSGNTINEATGTTFAATTVGTEEINASVDGYNISVLLTIASTPTPTPTQQPHGHPYVAPVDNYQAPVQQQPQNYLPNPVSNPVVVQPGAYQTAPPTIAPLPEAPLHQPTILDMILPVIREYQFWLILIVIIIILIAILRRWWTRRQNPSLFRKFD